MAYENKLRSHATMDQFVTDQQQPVTDNPARYVEDDETGMRLAVVEPAPRQVVDLILGAEVGTGEGRSEWFQCRFANGDLALLCFPQGGTYEVVSEAYPMGWPDEPKGVPSVG